MQDDEATLDGESAGSLRPPESDRFARPRIRLATPDETRAYAPAAPDSSRIGASRSGSSCAASERFGASRRVPAAASWRVGCGERGRSWGV